MDIVRSRLLWPLFVGCLALVSAVPYPYPYPYPYAMPYPMPYPMPRAFPMPRAMPRAMPKASGGEGRGAAAAQAIQKDPKTPVVYAPYPGEIVFKLLQNWNTELLDMTSPEFQILEGNLRSAVQTVMGPQTQVTNVYFREGYVPGNPPSRPKTVAHMMVNGGSDAASVLERAVTPDGSLGDGLKVYKDSFNAY